MDGHSPLSRDDGSHCGDGEGGDGLELHFDGGRFSVGKGVWFGVSTGRPKIVIWSKVGRLIVE